MKIKFGYASEMENINTVSTQNIREFLLQHSIKMNIKVTLTFYLERSINLSKRK